MHKILKKCISLVILNSITTWLSALVSGAKSILLSKSPISSEPTPRFLIRLAITCFALASANERKLRWVKNNFLEIKVEAP
jgi:hypothetical protein